MGSTAVSSLTDSELLPPKRGAHILEGYTSVDVYLETREAVIVIEGKRTEPVPTTHTKWMPGRHQMLRNLDAAWDREDGKRIAGFFIVEAKRGGRDVPKDWRRFVNETTTVKALDGSLPHRTTDERPAIAKAFLGATTWQAIVAAFGLPHSLLIDTL